jgi:hypothetical protein
LLFPCVRVLRSFCRFIQLNVDTPPSRIVVGVSQHKGIPLSQLASRQPVVLLLLALAAWGNGHVHDHRDLQYHIIPLVG